MFKSTKAPANRDATAASGSAGRARPPVSGSTVLAGSEAGGGESAVGAALVELELERVEFSDQTEALLPDQASTAVEKPAAWHA